MKTALAGIESELADRLRVHGDSELREVLRVHIERAYRAGWADAMARAVKLRSQVNELKERNADLIRQRNQLLRDRRDQ